MDVWDKLDKVFKKKNEISLIMSDQCVYVTPLEGKGIAETQPVEEHRLDDLEELFVDVECSDINTLKNLKIVRQITVVLLICQILFTVHQEEDAIWLSVHVD